MTWIYDIPVWAVYAIAGCCCAPPLAWLGLQVVTWAVREIDPGFVPPTGRSVHARLCAFRLRIRYRGLPTVTPYPPDALSRQELRGLRLVERHDQMRVLQADFRNKAVKGWNRKARA